MTDKEIEAVFKGVPTFSYENKALIDLLVENHIASSKREAREFLAGNAISVNGKIVTDVNFLLDSQRKYSIVRRGKKKYFVFEKLN